MKNNFRIKLILLEANIIAATLLMASCNNMPKSANADMSGTSKQDTTKARDVKFPAKAAMINMEEIRLGELASKTAQLRMLKNQEKCCRMTIKNHKMN
jgi:hypothetical protein